MKASFYYPMMGTGRTRQGRTEKMGLVIGDWTVEVPEATTEDAPVALYVCPDGKPTYGIRWHDGALYRAFPTGEGIVREADGGLRVIGLTRRLERFLGNRMQEEIINGRSRQSYYPDGIASSHIVNDLQNGNCKLGENWTRPDGYFVFDDDGMVEAEYWRALAEQAAGCLLLVDGTLWERCEEPVYKIATRASPGVDVIGGRPIAATKRVPILADTDPDDRLFNALEYELALDAKATAKEYKKPGCKEDSDFIEVFVPQAVQYQSAEGEMRRLARLLIEDVEREMADATKNRTTKWSDRFPVALIAAWNDVRNAELGFDLPGGHDRTEEAVMALVAQMAPFNARPQGCLRDEDVEALLSRWHDREISLDSVAYGNYRP
ncbi:hypothetical protein OIU34_24040 [Pararhizobium sp. BT-229]|uniref:hypothetical protein n=1 Tax=Pararhizobium sp. BT-229 TaxID=2986923 RepID=UPI0021F6B78E|nr:hypothetical protein [Pararhizobium sp. BT-229]MCV9964970.1 hypothetical protein [Pararhizobium sp. BT-229]